MKIATVGHSSRSLAELIALLHHHHVAKLVDVRSHPGSKRFPHFSRARLEQELPRHGIAYGWQRQLGGMRKQQGESIHSALVGSPFAAYADYMLTDAFAQAIETVFASAATAPTALMCAEARPQDCHRQLIADWLASRGVAVRHLLSIEQVVDHRLSELARLDGDMLIYDRGQLSLP